MTGPVDGGQYPQQVPGYGQQPPQPPPGYGQQPPGYPPQPGYPQQQPPGYGQQPPGYGQQAPGYAQQPPAPPYGGYPGYGPAGTPPGSPGSKNKLAMIIAAAVVVAAGVAVLLVVLLGGDDKKKSPISQGSDRPTTPIKTQSTHGTDFPTQRPTTRTSRPSPTTSSGSAELPKVEDARVVVKSYLQAVTDADRSAAKPLICSAWRDQWESDGSAEFDAGIKDINFTLKDSSGTSDGLEMTYELQYVLDGNAQDDMVVFTLINERGKPVICDISTK